VSRSSRRPRSPQGYNVSVHVLGREGQVITAVRGVGAGQITFENSMKNTANTQKRPSGAFANALKNSPTPARFSSATLSRPKVRCQSKLAMTHPTSGPPRRENISAMLLSNFARSSVVHGARVCMVIA
jgi:hypothetical protein